jgi:hypothetical protein
MRYYNIDLDKIDFASDIIKDVLPLKCFDKVCKAIGISCEVSFVDNDGNQHTPKKYGVIEPIMKLILIYDHFMPNITLSKSQNSITNRNIKLSSLINHVMRKQLLQGLPMKYCHCKNCSNRRITDLN